MKASAFVLVLASTHTLAVEAVTLKSSKRGICVPLAHIEGRSAVANLHALYVAPSDADVGEEVFEGILVEPVGLTCIYMDCAVALGFAAATVTPFPAVSAVSAVVAPRCIPVAIRTA